MTNAIKVAIERIARKRSRLGAHLSTAMGTGTYCCYRPDQNDTLGTISYSHRPSGDLFSWKYAVEPMRKARGRSIISTSSIASFLASAYGAAYAAAKRAVISLTPLRLKFGPNHIRVNCICPGAINTPIWGAAAGFRILRRLRNYSTMRRRYRGSGA